MEGIVDDRASAEITRPFRSIEDDNDIEVKRQRLGEPPATIPEEVAGAVTSDMMTDDPVPHVHEEARRERFTSKRSKEREELSIGRSDPKQMRTACSRVSSVNALLKPSKGSEDNTVESREVHIKLCWTHA